MLVISIICSGIASVISAIIWYKIGEKHGSDNAIAEMNRRLNCDIIARCATCAECRTVYIDKISGTPKVSCKGAIIQTIAPDYCSSYRLNVSDNPYQNLDSTIRMDQCQNWCSPLNK